MGSRGEDLFPPTVLQASRKAGTRGKAAATKQAQRGSSNVFSMFEQAQIQEFKEVSAPAPMAWNRVLAPHPAYTPSSLYSVVLAPVLAPSTLQDPSPPPAFPGVGALPTRRLCPSPRRPSAASTRTAMALSASQTFGRPTPSSVRASTFPLLWGLLTAGSSPGSASWWEATEKAQASSARQPAFPLPCSHLPPPQSPHTPLPHWSQLPITSHFSTLLWLGRRGSRPEPHIHRVPHPHQGR